MTNQIVPFDPNSLGITITTTEGQQVSITADQIISLLPGMTPGGKPLPQIKVGQPKDDFAAGQLYLMQREVAVDETGARQRIKNYAGPFGKSMMVYPIGSTVNRVLMPEYDAKAESQEPLCRSENSITPDTRFADVYASCCARLDPKSGRLVDVCPMAQWKRNGEKSIPPACRLQYIVAVAFQHEDQVVYAECYFKSVSAPAGKSILGNLLALKQRNIPIYTYPLELVVMDAGQGYSFGGRLRTDKTPISAETTDVSYLQEGLLRWNEAMQVRAQRAAKPAFEEEPAQGDQPSPSTLMDAQQATPASNGKGGKTPNGNGRKALV